MAYIDMARTLTTQQLKQAHAIITIPERKADIEKVLQEREEAYGEHSEAVLAAEVLADAFSAQATVPQMLGMVELTKKSFERVGPTLSGPAFLARLENHLRVRLHVNTAQCEARLPGHKHCQHGHAEDCPDPGKCEIF